MQRRFTGIEEEILKCNNQSYNDQNPAYSENLAYSVRPAREKDLGQIAELYTRSFPEHIMVNRGFLNNPEYLKQRITNPDEVWAVEEENGIIRGVAALAICRPVGLGEIERVCVDIPYRGNGVAHAICKYLVGQAKEQGLGFVESFARGCQPAMQRTFEKLGFAVLGVSPRFEIMYQNRIMREQFVHMGIELKPETIKKEILLIPAAQRLYDVISDKS